MIFENIGTVTEKNDLSFCLADPEMFTAKLRDLKD